jgi:hypothetical protein
VASSFSFSFLPSGLVGKNTRSNLGKDHLGSIMEEGHAQAGAHRGSLRGQPGTMSQGRRNQTSVTSETTTKRVARMLQPRSVGAMGGRVVDSLAMTGRHLIIENKIRKHPNHHTRSISLVSKKLLRVGHLQPNFINLYLNLHYYIVADASFSIHRNMNM